LFAVLGLFQGVLGGCAAGPEEDFIGDRIPDKCGSNWPVCDTFAGCRLDSTSYVTGKLPGRRKLIVHSQGPARIDVSMLVENAQAEGTEADITLFEPGCGVQYRTQVDGRSFFAESQSASGVPFVRGADVSTGGDHLIEVGSDATATYLLKVTVQERDPYGTQ
jgi:hypothetical protein